MSMWIQDIAQAKRPVQFILTVSRPFRGVMVGALLFGALASGTNALLPLAYKFLVDAIANVVPTDNHEELIFWVVVYVLVLAGHMLLWRLAAVCVAYWSTGLRASARYALTAYATKHSSSFFENRLAGSISNKLNHAAEGARDVVSSVAFDFWPFIVGLFVSMCVAFSASILLGLIFLCWLAVVVPLNFYMARKRVPHSVLAQQTETKLRGETVDLITNMRAMHEYVRRPHELEKFKDLILYRRKVGLRNWLFGEIILSVNAATQLLFTVVMIVVAVWAVTSNATTPGVVVLIISLSLSVGRDIFYIGNQFNNFAEYWGELKEGLEEILNPHDIIDNPKSPTLVVSEGAIFFDDVSFRYKDGQPLISHFSLSISPNQKVGLVGRSGAGKSTLIKLLLRHYNVSSGTISIDGQNIATVGQEELRDQIATVPQEPMLFHRTIRENILYGRLDATKEELYEATQQAQAHEFIEKLSHGYETLVGERGVKLSGGERQRIALARALLKQSKVLILDEATSSLDSESEIAIQKAFTTLMKNKTVLAVAHRLSTLRQMDRIIVLDQGKIVEDGSHEELLQKGGLYSELWSHQSGGYLQDEE